jgi:hypothetical protein
VREAIRLRQEGGKASTAKLDAMLKVVTADSRLHGLSLYHGAGTGRETGRLVQPHNFPTRRGREARLRITSQMLCQGPTLSLTFLPRLL